MFALNLGYRWNLPAAVEPVRSVVFLPVANHAEKIRRARAPEAQRVLFDPQLYLAGLDGSKAKKACARLSTYPWFAVEGLPSYDSGGERQSEWEKRLREAISEKWTGLTPTGDEAIQHAVSGALQYQVSLGCSHVILPTPLIGEREDEAEIQAIWLDAGLLEAHELEVGQPLLATVALDETTLNDGAFEENGFLDTIIDQVTSRQGLDGVYIVIAQTHPRHPFETSDIVGRAYLHLCSAFSNSGLDTVFANFCDVFGLLCTAVGATGFATGPSAALRRLALTGFRDGGGGGTNLPKLYSHKVVAELLPETDLDHIAERRLLGRVRDITPHSQALFAQLAKGRSAADLPAWAESQNNTSAAQRHFLHRAASITRGTLKLPLPERQDAVRDWLESAAANELLLRRRLKEKKLEGRVAPSEQWLDALNAFAPDVGEL